MDGVKDEVHDMTTWDDLLGFLRNEDLRIPTTLGSGDTCCGVVGCWVRVLRAEIDSISVYVVLIC